MEGGAGLVCLSLAITGPLFASLVAALVSLALCGRIDAAAASATALFARC